MYGRNWADHVLHGIRSQAETELMRESKARSARRDLATWSGIFRDHEMQDAIARVRNGRARVGLGSYLCQIGLPGGVALMTRGLEEEAGRAAA